MTSRPTPGLALRIALRVEALIDGLTTRFGKPLTPDQPLLVIAYHGFGNSIQAQLSGRIVLKKKRTVLSGGGRRNNMRNNYAHFDTDELAGISIQGQFSGCHADTVSDDEGYFTLIFNAENAIPDQHVFASSSDDSTSHTVTIKLPHFSNVYLEGDPGIMLPAESARFGIISDVDDTLMVTKATSLLHMLKLTLLESAESRVAYPGIAEFYSAMHNNVNPFFYVSSSPWNLYSFLKDFMRFRGIVPGPLMLRDFGLDESKFIAGSHTDHKLTQIRRVLDYYPDLPFILSGDSGQDDPQIYAQIAQEYEGRIKAIYIRDVGSDTARARVQALCSELAEQGIEMLLLENTSEAAIHAAKQGFILPDALITIRQLDNIDFD